MITVSRTTAILILVLTTLFWGSSYAFTKKLTQDFSPLWLVTFRFGLAGIVLLALARNEIIAAVKTGAKADLLQLCFLGVLNFLAIVCFTTSLKEIEVTNSGFIVSSALLLVPVIEFIFWRKPFRRKTAIALLLLSMGLYFLSFGWSLPKPFRSGESIAFVSAVLYSFYIILIGILSRKFHSGVIMSFLFIITAAIAYPAAWFSSGVQLSAFTNPETCINMAYLALAGTAIPYVLMGVGQRTLDTQTASFIYLLEPVFAGIIALLFFGEPIGIAKYVGAGIILAGQYMAIGGKKG